MKARPARRNLGDPRQRAPFGGWSRSSKCCRERSGTCGAWTIAHGRAVFVCPDGRHGVPTGAAGRCLIQRSAGRAIDDPGKVGSTSPSSRSALHRDLSFSSCFLGGFNTTFFVARHCPLGHAHLCFCCVPRCLLCFRMVCDKGMMIFWH